LKVAFSDSAAEVFRELPAPVQRQAERCIALAAVFPRMYATRGFGLMQGYRYFTSKGYLFYYRFTQEELRIAAIIPGRMEAA
jgi:plasmid stabilization system protein ParE